MGDCLAVSAPPGHAGRAEPSSEALHDGTDPSRRARDDGYPSPRGPRPVCGWCVARIRTTDPRRVVGAKPAAFCWWLFDLLGALPGDELVDLFPGSGGIGRAWRLYASAGESRRNTGEQTAGAACG